MKRLVALTLSAVMLVAMIAVSGGAPLTFAVSVPSVSVGAVSVSPNPALRPNNPVSVSASVTPTYDSNNSTPTLGRCDTDRSGATITGYHRDDTTNVVTVTNKTVAVSASDNAGSPNTTTLSGPVTGGTFTGSLAVASPDGKYSVTVTALASETYTTETDTTSLTWPASAGGCIGDPTTSNTAYGLPSANQRTGQGSASTTYVVDRDAPTWGANAPNVAQPSVSQGGFANVHILVNGGSAGTNYSWTATATGPGGPYTFSDTGTFGASGDGNGIAPPENSVGALNFPCDAPLGLYTINVTVTTYDLGGVAWSDLPSVAGTVNVTPGVSLEAQALVVAEINAKYSTLPSLGFSIVTGSEHTALTISFAGQCVGQSTANLGDATLTLPTGFAFDKTGASPQVHWFQGPAATGFDLHYPVGYTEKTAKPAISVSEQTATVHLSGLGTIPTSDAVYLRAHIKWVGPGTPPSHNTFTDTIQATAFNGDTSAATTATATYDVTYP